MNTFMVQILQKYKEAGQDTIILAGAEYGSGSSRDWAAKGPMLLVCSFFYSLFVLINLMYEPILNL